MTSRQSPIHFDAVDVDGESLGLFDGEAILYPGFYDAATAEALFPALQQEIPWARHWVKLFAREQLAPRLSAWHGDPEASYSYSGFTRAPLPWTATLTSIRLHVEALAGAHFNSVLANQYRDSNDSVDWHSDDKPSPGIEPVIASVSFGATRRFILKHKQTHARISVDLEAGTVLIMRGATQANWRHKVPKTKRPVDPRINLTYRLVKPLQS